MFRSGSIQSHLTLRDKIFSLDPVLVTSIFLIGFISFFAMYSTDGGQFAYHTKSHILRFFIFFFLFFIISFVSLSFWYNSAILIYLGVLALLILVKYFGLTSSGSQRWLNLYFLNLQPSELMKIGLILFLAKYYHRISSGDVNKIRYMIQPFIALLLLRGRAQGLRMICNLVRRRRVRPR